MVCTVAILSLLILIAGCEKPAGPRPAVSTNTQANLRHNHKHRHGETHRHEHEHDDSFSGSHSHPHAHGHRHAPAPHGGALVSLRWTKGDAADSTAMQAGENAIPAGLHLELIAELPRGISLYFLRETSQGKWVAWDGAAAAPTVQISMGPRDLQLPAMMGEEDGAFSVRFDAETSSFLAGQSTPFRIAKLKIKLGDDSLEVPETLVQRKSGLDVLVE
jgi:hypothetical protein